MRRGGRALGAGLALVLALMACADRASFGGGSFAAIERAIRREGLHVCSTRTLVLANEAIAGRAYRVALRCRSDDDVQLVADEFASKAARDAAASALEGQVRPRADGAVWTFGRFAISIDGARDTEVEDRLVDALERLGAR